jgi:hypothetical protein
MVDAFSSEILMIIKYPHMLPCSPHCDEICQLGPNDQTLGLFRKMKLESGSDKQIKTIVVYSVLLRFTSPDRGTLIDDSHLHLNCTFLRVALMLPRITH